MQTTDKPIYQIIGGDLLKPYGAASRTASGVSGDKFAVPPDME
ncbi:hypothetical protein ACH35V_01250 [Actinomadura sp. 1N219]